MLKLKLQYFGHLMRRTDLFEKILMPGKIESRRTREGWDGWMASLTQWTWVWVSSGSWWGTGKPGMLQSMRSQKIGYDLAAELNWMGVHTMILVFNAEFQAIFSLSSFILIKRLFSSSSLSAIRVASSAYLRLLIFLLAILIPACDLPSPEFHMMYSAYNLNKQGDNIQPCHTSFPILNQFFHVQF